MASWKQSNGVAIGAAAVIGLSLIMIIYQAVGSCSPGRDSYQPVPVWCADCEMGEVVPLDLEDSSTRFPITCPHCEQNTAYPAVYCEECEEVFGLEVERLDPENLVQPQECAVCGTTNTEALRLMNVEDIMNFGLEELFNLPEGYFEGYGEEGMEPYNGEELPDE